MPDLKQLITAAVVAAGFKTAELSLVIVDDKEIAKLHEVWLGVPGPTDVITFDLSSSTKPTLTTESHDFSSHVAGEIIASAETALHEAKRYHWQPEHELAYYLVHGLLHLCGYDDGTTADRRAMRRRERRLMEEIGLPQPPRRVPQRRRVTTSQSR